jgi:uncharacterized protein YkwD
LLHKNLIKEKVKYTKISQISVKKSLVNSFMSSQLINQVLELTNAERAKAGLKPLTLNNQLAQAAQGHSDSMAADDFFSHTGADGSDVSDRVQDTGYQYSHAGENIAAGQKTAAEVVQGWMDSPGHRANILNADYTEIGIGYELLENDTGSVNYHHYWTQVFGTPQGNSNQPNPPEEKNNNPVAVEDNSNNNIPTEDSGKSSDLENDNPVDTVTEDSAVTSPGSKDNLTGTAGDSLMAGDDQAVNFPENEVSSDKSQFDPNNYKYSGDFASFYEDLGLGNSDLDMSHGESMFGEDHSSFDLNHNQHHNHSENPESLF